MELRARPRIDRRGMKRRRRAVLTVRQNKADKQSDSWLALRRLFIGPRSGERVVHVIVSFVTRVFEQRIAGVAPQRECDGPGLRPGRRIVNGYLIVQGVG